MEVKLEISDLKPRSQTPTTSKPIARRWQAEDVSGDGFVSRRPAPARRRPFAYRNDGAAGGIMRAYSAPRVALIKPVFAAW